MKPINALIIKTSSIAGLLFLSACASIFVDLPSYDKLLKSSTEQNGRACIRQSDLQGFGVLDDDLISINSRRKNQYFLATTYHRCYSLDFSFSVGFKSNFNQICGGGRDQVLTADESCQIQSVFEFESREAAFAAFDLMKKQREEIRAEAMSNKTLNESIDNEPMDNEPMDNESE